jgi:membrane-bound lytic murein transglycosylase B
MRARSILGATGLAIVALSVAIWIAASHVPAQTGVAITAPVIPAPVATASPSSPSSTIVPDAAWLTTTSAATGIPMTALTAYAQASLVIGSVDSGCHLGWNTLAALGSVESGHGTINGSRADDAGNVSPVILGPVLDGTRYNAIRDTDVGEWDADTEWDRAVGPLQFLPATWALYGSDANADGTIDPNNLFDASLSAGNYLCAAAEDLSVPSAWTAAIMAYNPNESYVGRVRAAAIAYGE